MPDDTDSGEEIFEFPDQRHEQLEALAALAKDKDLLDPAEKPPDGARARIQLPTDNRELHDFAREVGNICRQNHLYRRDLSPVIINAENKRLDPMTADLFRTWVSDYVACYRLKKIKVPSEQEEDEETTITVQRIKTMLLDTSRGALSSLHLLAQLYVIGRINETRLPVIFKDGHIDLLKPGYFEELGIYTFDDGLQLDQAMTKAQAVEIINDLVQYFPFPNPRSKAVLVAGMLTMFCATMLPKEAFRPAFIFTANSTGAGKTLGAKICIVPVSGSASTRTFPRKEEAKKILDVIAMSGANYALFDNIRGKIAGEEIEGMITASRWKGRILGESTEFVVDNVVTFFLTGNQSTTSQDMEERSLFVELFVQEADNRDRKIPFVINDSYLALPATRTRILSALWALVRAWDADGRPAPPSIMPRFEAWSQVVAAITANAGFGDPLAKPDLSTGTGHEELRDFTALVAALAPTGDDTREEWKFAEIVTKAQELGLFSDVEVRSGNKTFEQMFDDSGITMAGKSHFGKMLGRYDRRVFAVANRPLRFLVEGKGNTRVYAVIVDAQLPAL